jgi:hypothetical protein
MRSRQDSRVSEAEARGALAIDDSRSSDALEVVLADRAVVADSVDVEKTPVGREADLLQGREVL